MNKKRRTKKLSANFFACQGKAKLAILVQFSIDMIFANISTNTDQIWTKQRPFDRSALAPS